MEQADAYGIERASGLDAFETGTVVRVNEQRLEIDPFAAIERRVGRMVLGGRRSLTTSASRDVAIEAATLTGALLPTARRALEELLAASATTRRPAEAAPALLAAWTRAYVVTMTLRRALAMAAWAGPVFQS